MREARECLADGVLCSLFPCTAEPSELRALPCIPAAASPEALPLPILHLVSG